MKCCFEHLAENPEIVRLRYEIDPPVRLYLYQEHVIVYRTDRDGILIVSVLHQNMDWLSYLIS